MNRTTFAALLGVVCFLGYPRADVFGADPDPARAAPGGREPLYHERLRPQFHFTARYWEDYRLHPPNHYEGWMNDLNGLVYNQGEYHLFAQRWWSAWLHAVSTDLIHWEELRPAFGKGGRFGGTQSGGGVVDLNNCSGLGNGKEPPMIVFWSSTDNLNQCISYSQDRGRTWTKYEKNPVLVHAHRDPNVFWYEPDQKWILILYGPCEDVPKRKWRYGFNGESNDAHDLRPFQPNEWTCSVLRLFDNGRVVVTDANGQSDGKVDVVRENVGASVFRVGAKSDDTEFLQGDVAAVLVYDRPLSDDETRSAIHVLRSDAKLEPGDNRSNLPTDGLVLRLAPDAVEVDGAGAVAAWKDQSGRSHHLKQVEASRRPQFLAGGPGGGTAIHFGGRQFMDGPAVLAEGDDSFTFVALWRRSEANESQVICEQNAAAKATGRRASLLTVSQDKSENCYLLFSSTNLLEWKQLEGRIPDSFECPDMFEVAVDGEVGTKKWVVVDGNGDYVTGSFDGQVFRGETSKRKGDYGRNFYATMTFDQLPKSDPRRIQVAWMRGWDDYPKDMPFNQQATFPCELSLRRLPQGLVLCRYPVREIKGIQHQLVARSDFRCRRGENPLATIQGELLDLDLTIDTALSTCSAIELEFGGNTVRYDLKRQRLTSQGAEAAMEPRLGKVQLRVLVDRLSIETFGNRGEVSITNIARKPPGAPSALLRVSDGEAVVQSLTVHELESIWKAK